MTEPSYLDILKDQGVPLAEEVPVEMHIANRRADSGRKPLDLVEQAIRLKHEEDRKAKRAKLEEKYLPQVWCLFDSRLLTWRPEGTASGPPKGCGPDESWR
ncbi:RloB family protein [Streptomyces sp. Tue 6430]|nr:RloB family protein [Streptomyces sp. Tue 6430]